MSGDPDDTVPALRLVEISFERDSLAQSLAEMRLWLDARRFEPSTFAYDVRWRDVLVAVTFKVEAEADAFADRFGGRFLAPEPTRTEPAEAV